MADILRIKRRSSGNPGAPATLAYAELAYNEVNDILYYGKGNNAGQAISIIPIAGPGFVSGGSSIAVGDTPPATPADNSMWYETDTAILWLRYNDSTSTQWIQISGPPIPASNLFLPLTGGTLTGGLTIAPASGYSALFLTKSASGQGCIIQGNTGANTRWVMALGDATPESAGAGSNFFIQRFNDAGTYIDTPLTISRATGSFTFIGDELRLSPVSTSATLNLNKSASGLANYVTGMKAGLIRWSITLGDGSAESTGNAGSLFAITRWNDAGSVIDSPIIINRATGVVNFAKSIGLAGIGYVPSDTIDGTIFTSGNVTFTGGGLTVNVYYHAGAGWKYWGNGFGSILASSGAGGWDFYGVPSGSQGNAAAITRMVAMRYFGGVLQPASVASVIGVGFASSGYGIHLRQAGDNSWPVVFSNAADAVTGSIYVTASATTYATTSDASLKEDLQSFDAGPIIDSTKVYDFAWKDTGERAKGVVAQEALEVYPQAVAPMGNDGPLGIDYSKYVPLLLQELKALRQRVAALEDR